MVESKHHSLSFIVYCSVVSRFTCGGGTHQPRALALAFLLVLVHVLQYFRVVQISGPEIEAKRI